MKPGDVFVVPLANGWFGAAQLIGQQDGWNRFFILDGHWASPPTPEVLVACEPVRHPEEAELFGLQEEWSQMWPTPVVEASEQILRHCLVQTRSRWWAC